MSEFERLCQACNEAEDALNMCPPEDFETVNAQLTKVRAELSAFIKAKREEFHK